MWLLGLLLLHLLALLLLFVFELQLLRPYFCTFVLLRLPPPLLLSLLLKSV